MTDSFKRNVPCAIFVANRGFALANSRLTILRHFVRSGWRTVAAVAPDKFASRLTAEGVLVEPVPIDRSGCSPVRDYRTLQKLRELYRRYQPALIQHFNAKPIILGSMAAKHMCSAKIFNTVTGLGHAFSNGSWLRHLSVAGYRSAFKRNVHTIFQNADDQELFTQKGWCPADKATLIVSSGVDTHRFRPLGVARQSESMRVVMLSRLLWQKGIREFVEAAGLCRRELPAARFQLAGEWSCEHPDGVSRQWLQAHVDSGNIEYLGYLERAEDVLQNADVLVLPSYREGVPRALLEAAACAVPVITTDVPGCREAVIAGKTGLLVPPKDTRSLASTILNLLAQPERRRAMGRSAREFAVAKFDTRVITEQYLSLYHQACSEVPPRLELDRQPWAPAERVAA